MSDKAHLLKLLEEQKRRKKYNQLSCFEPYAWHREFFAASKDNRQKLAMCFGGDSLVWMANGDVKPIRDVQVGEWVLSQRPGGTALVPKQVQEKTCTYAENVRKASWGRSENNTFFVTDDHLMLTKEGKLRPIGKYSATDTTAIPLRAEVKPSGAVSPADEALLWLVGAYLGDGSYNRTNGSIKITNIDQDVIAKMHTCASLLGMTVRQVGMDYYLSGDGKGRNPLVNWLRKHAVLHNKRIDKCLPDLLGDICEAEIRALVDGLFATDGHSTKTDFRFYNTSRKLVYQLKLLLLKLGITATVQVRKYANKKHNTCYRLVVSGEELKQKLGNVTGKPIKANPRRSQQSRSRKIHLSEECYPQQVFCLSLGEGDDLFVCEGFLVSNCANRVGKTFGGARELAYHATGLYPDWWEGIRFKGPIDTWACGMTNNSTRDIVQKELLGDPGNPDAHGTGAIPLHCIGTTTRKPGVPNALDSVLVKHFDENGVQDGWSKIGFMSYEMGQNKFMGASKSWVWLDEEPPQDIFTQCVTRTVTTGGVVSMTFTPEQGLTPVVAGFMNDRKPGQFMIQATWDDVTEKRDAEGNIVQRGHLTTESIEQLLAVYPPHEREMRTKGIPVYGSGAVFPIHLEDHIRIDPFEMPQHWPRICGLDFGWDHPTAAVWIAWDRDSDCLYVYDCYTQRQATAVIHADAIKRRGNIPVAWPKDGLQADKGSGVGLAEQYRALGVNMLPEPFKNNSLLHVGASAFAIEPGIQEIYARMENGTFRVFSHLADWFREFRQYYRQDGKIVPMGDDIMSATRYAACSASRYAMLPNDTQYHYRGEIKYKPLGPAYR